MFIYFICMPFVGNETPSKVKFVAFSIHNLLEINIKLIMSLERARICMNYFSEVTYILYELGSSNGL